MLARRDEIHPEVARRRQKATKTMPRRNIFRPHVISNSKSERVAEAARFLRCAHFLCPLSIKYTRFQNQSGCVYFDC